MDNAIGDFLRARRELVRPEDVGLPTIGHRRVKGLRREELATLAGVSVDYYVRLEQGRERNPSLQVCEALARVLRLEADGAAHLQELARPAPRPARPAPDTVSPAIRRLLATYADTPALVVGPRLDVLAHNALAAALHDTYVTGANVVRSMFLAPGVRDFFPDWEVNARDTVASLRASIGTDLDDPALTDLVGELSLKSPEFLALWARHDVHEKTSGIKRMRHPQVGDLELHYESLSVNSAPGQMLMVYSAEPGSATERGLARLAAVVAARRSA